MDEFKRRLLRKLVFGFGALTGASLGLLYFVKVILPQLMTAVLGAVTQFVGPIVFLAILYAAMKRLVKR